MSIDLPQNTNSASLSAAEDPSACSYEVMLRVPDFSNASPDPSEDIKSSSSDSSRKVRAIIENFSLKEKLQASKQIANRAWIRQAALLASCALLAFAGGLFLLQSPKQNESAESEADSFQWEEEGESAWKDVRSTPHPSPLEIADASSQDQASLQEGEAPNAQAHAGQVREASARLELFPRNDSAMHIPAVAQPDISLDSSATLLYKGASSNTMLENTYPVTDPTTYSIVENEPTSEASESNQNRLDSPPLRDGDVPHRESRLEGRIEHLPLR